MRVRARERRVECRRVSHAPCLGTLLGTGGDQSNILLERRDGSGGVASFEENDGLTVCRVTSNSNLEPIGKIEKVAKGSREGFRSKAGHSLL